jgi:siroheme decarboxylase
VTHNYERRHEYNVWFTLIAPSLAEKKRIIEELIRQTGVDILELPAKRIFKIRVDFRF